MLTFPLSGSTGRTTNRLQSLHYQGGLSPSCSEDEQKFEVYVSEDKLQHEDPLC